MRRSRTALVESALSNLETVLDTLQTQPADLPTLLRVSIGLLEARDQLRRALSGNPEDVA